MASAASTTNDGKNISATSSSDDSDASSKHSAKNDVKKSNTDASIIENSNTDEITNPVKSEPRTCLILQRMQNRHHSQQEESYESPPEPIAKKLPYLNNGDSEHSGSNDSTSQRIDSVLQKCRDRWSEYPGLTR